MTATVDHQTMRPAAVSLWLRPSAADRAPFCPGARVEDRPDEINQGLERTLGNVKRLVEEAGAAGT
ncbi:MAG TPA: hypothetical protein VFQ49_04360 [Actinomycetes bacterium]|nr:hypothetical protein [Actinomycetes bacterium]